jgi:hypothetical protein
MRSTRQPRVIPRTACESSGGRRGATTCLLLALVGTLAIGRATWAEEPPRAKPEEPEPLQAQIARHGTATLDDACRLFLSLAVEHGRVKLDRAIEGLSFDEVTTRLVEVGLICPHWTLESSGPARRDFVAYLGCNYLGFRPGVLTGLLGMTPRYAHRELQYRRIIGPGVPGGFVSGSELLSVASRVARRAAPEQDYNFSDDEIH